MLLSRIWPKMEIIFLMIINVWNGLSYFWGLFADIDANLMKIKQQSSIELA